MADNEASLLIRIKQVGGEVLSSISDNLEHLKDVALEAGIAIIAFAADAIKEFKASEAASNALTQSMVQQGIYTKELKSSYDAMAESLQKTTTYSHDQVTEAQALLQAQIGQIPVSESLLKATMDLAAAKRMDLASAADIVGKSIGTETNALKRQGIELTQTATASEKLAQVVTQLNSKFGGQAEAAGLGLGALDKLKNSIQDFMQTAGAALAPVIEAAAKELISLFDAISKTSGAFDGLKMVVGNVMIIMNGVVSGIVDVVAGVSATLGALAGATDLAMRGQFKAAIASLKDANTEIDKMHQDAETAAIERAKRISDATLTVTTEQNKKEVLDLQTSEDNKAQVKAEHAAQDFINHDVLTQERVAYDQAIRMSELTDVDGFHTAKLQAEVAHFGALAKAEQDYIKKAALLRQQDNAQKLLNEDTYNKAKLQAQKDTFATIATLSQSNNTTLATIGKAAAITQIAIDTPVAISKTLAAFPAPYNFIAAGLVGVAMAAQAAKIAGVQLAEGGIVRASPGGTLATIGEGGRDEAVIPLEDGQIPGVGGGGNTIVFNGPILANEDQAMAFAKVIDRALLKLRQSNQSVAFETDIT